MATMSDFALWPFFNGHRGKVASHKLVNLYHEFTISFGKDVVMAK